MRDRWRRPVASRAPWPRRAPQRHNPLRRTSDRLQFWLAVAAVAVFVVTAVLAATAAARAGHATQQDVVREQRAERRAVTAHLVSEPGGGDEGGQSARVRWSDRDGTEHRERTGVAPDARRGDPVRIWVDRDGHIARAPAPPSSPAATGAAAAGLAVAGVAVVTLSAHTGLRLLLDRHRYARWDAEWEALEPVWSHRPHG
jgi:hypothetical protein